MCSECFLRLIIILRCSFPLLNSHLISWLKTINSSLTVISSQLVLGHGLPMETPDMSYSQKKSKIKQTEVIIEQIIDFCTILLSIVASWQAKLWMSILEKSWTVSCAFALFTLNAFRMKLVHIQQTSEEVTNRFRGKKKPSEKHSLCSS